MGITMNDIKGFTAATAAGLLSLGGIFWATGELMSNDLPAITEANDGLPSQSQFNNSPGMRAMDRERERNAPIVINGRSTTLAKEEARAKANVQCDKPAPTSAKAFDKMFRSLPTSQWGAADVGLSVELEDGRSVWLWGDTMSDNRFVHSTAITQTAGCLHVSHKGAQLLPNDGDRYYWIEGAEARGDDEVMIWAEEMVADPKAEWGFRYTGWNRVALATVDQAGDVTFSSWVGKTAQPQAAKVENLQVFKNGQIGYSPRIHNQFELASGKTLLTEARNWTDGKVHHLDTYRPVFKEVRR